MSEKNTIQLYLCFLSFIKNNNMTRILLLLLMMSVSTMGFAQDNNRNEELEKSLQKLKSQNRILSSRLAESEAQTFQLRESINKIQEEVKLEIRKAQELQAQNERAVNIALDEFAKKFEEQNKTMASVKEELSSKMSQQLIFSGGAFVVLLIVFIIVGQSNTKRALKQNTASWNNFQEHILKK